MFYGYGRLTYLIPSDEGKAKVYSNWGLNMLWIKQNLKPVDQRKKATHSLFTEKLKSQT